MFFYLSSIALDRLVGFSIGHQVPKYNAIDLNILNRKFLIE